MYAGLRSSTDPAVAIASQRDPNSPANGTAGAAAAATPLASPHAAHDAKTTATSAMPVDVVSRSSSAPTPGPHQSYLDAATSALGNTWDWAKQQATTATSAIGSFDAAHGHVLTRAAGAAQAVGGGAEALAGAALAGAGGAASATGVGAAPGIPAMIGGAALGVNGADNAIAGVRTAITGEFHHTLVSQAAGAGAHALGADDKTAERITSGVDLAQGLAGGGASVAASVAQKAARTGGELSVAAHADQVVSGAAQASRTVGKTVAPTGEFYSVAFETKLSPTSYPGVSRGAHFQEANQALLDATHGDADFAKSMQGIGVNVQKTPTGLAPRTSPADYTWHHATEPGVMQLVPRDQHAPGSIFQDALHPDGRGGYAIWGK